MHSVRLLLETTKYDRQVIEKRFRALSHIHNVLVKKAKKSLITLRHNKEYQQVLAEYKGLVKLSRSLKAQEKELEKADSDRKEELSLMLKDIRSSLSLTEPSLQAYGKVCGKRYSKCLSSLQVQKEASRVWKGISKVLYSTGKDIHFKKQDSFTTIGGKSNTNGVKFNKESMSIDWLGLNINCKFPKKLGSAEYLLHSLEGNISYCDIKRMMFPNGWHYYVIVYVQSPAPCKHAPQKLPNVAGLDLGVSTFAAVSDNTVRLQELAPETAAYNRKINNLLWHMELSRRKSNPDNYNPDGTIKKLLKNSTGKKAKRVWTYSKSYLKKRNKLRSLYRAKSAYIKNSHERMCNELLDDAVNYITEQMSFSSLQRRAKKTERVKENSKIKKKDGCECNIFKYKKKKRFGRSLNNRSPALFLTILQRKCEQCGGKVSKVDTHKFKASQYDHVSDTYTKITLSTRSKIVGKSEVQRDLYSAFLLKNSNSELTSADRDKCIKTFDSFVKRQNALISEMRDKGISMKQCFGF